MHDSRLYCSIGGIERRAVFVAGGEYGTGAATAEVYDPVSDTWTQINPPASLLELLPILAGESVREAGVL